MKGLKGLSGLMKQAQEIQENMKKAQEEIGELEIEGQSGGGLVKTVINGKYKVRKVSIDPALLTDDLSMLEDLVAASFNDAVGKLEHTIKDKFSGVSGGLNLPGGMRLPF